MKVGLFLRLFCALYTMKGCISELGHPQHWTPSAIAKIHPQHIKAVKRLRASQAALPPRASTQQSRSLGLQCNLRSATSAHM